MMKRSIPSFFFIAIAAFLWASDAPFRKPILEILSSIQIVFLEHCIAILIVLAALAWKRKKFLLTKSSDWISAVFAGVGGSAIATVCFTQSFVYVNPTIPILLQKLQPVIVVISAYIFLGEVPQKKFYLWAPLAFLSAFFLSFPTLEFPSVQHNIDTHSKGIFFALVATVLWALATTFGRKMLLQNSVLLATFWRYFFGLVALCFFLWQEKNAPPLLQEIQNTNPRILFSLLYLGIFSGLLAMYAYYTGLAKTAANITTFIELIYPLSAILINSIVFGSRLTNTELFWAAILLLSVTMISVEKQKSEG